MDTQGSGLHIVRDKHRLSAILHEQPVPARGHDRQGSNKVAEDNESESEELPAGPSRQRSVQAAHVARSGSARVHQKRSHKYKTQTNQPSEFVDVRLS